MKQPRTLFEALTHVLFPRTSWVVTYWESSRTAMVGKNCGLCSL